MTYEEQKLYSVNDRINSEDRFPIFSKLTTLYYKDIYLITWKKMNTLEYLNKRFLLNLYLDGILVFRI